MGLSDLTPGKSVACTLHHSDGSEEQIELNHSYAPAQLEWFKVGSALNLFHTN